MALLFAAVAVLLPATASPTRAQSPLPETERCLVCHVNPDLAFKFADRTVHSGRLNAPAFRQSVHGQENVTCTDCHPDHTDYPHPRLAEKTPRDYTLARSAACVECHTEQADHLQDSSHARTLSAGNPGAPVCVDCHSSHNTAALKQLRQQVPQTCRRCHPDASANFPDSWTSHFPPTFSRQPLVASVNLFYLIAIPATIGLMGLFVVTDAGRRVLDRGRSRWGARDE